MKFVVFGGGGRVARHFTRLAVQDGHHVVPVIRDSTHESDLTALSAHPVILSLEDAPVPDLVSLLTSSAPDAVIFSAGAGGKGAEERTRKVDHLGAVKVYDAMEAANCKRLLLVGAVDVRDREKAVPQHYNEESRKQSERMWGAIPRYMQAKLDAEIELHKRKTIKFTVLRPGTLTLEPAGGCEMGLTQIGSTSRELVAEALLACAKEPSTAGLTIDIMDGDKSVESEVERVATEGTDAWTAAEA